MITRQKKALEKQHTEEKNITQDLICHLENLRDLAGRIAAVRAGNNTRESDKHYSSLTILLKMHEKAGEETFETIEKLIKAQEAKGSLLNRRFISATQFSAEVNLNDPHSKEQLLFFQKLQQQNRRSFPSTFPTPTTLIPTLMQTDDIIPLSTRVVIQPAAKR